MKYILAVFSLGLLSACNQPKSEPDYAKAVTTLKVDMHQVSAKGVGDALGYIDFSDTPEGLKIQPHLEGLKAVMSTGIHGFHIHQNPSCESAEKDGKVVAALGAGGHFDPLTTKSHEGPLQEGHLGDLPRFELYEDGRLKTPLLAPRLKAKDLVGRAVIIHEGGDNYSDTPEALGGGDSRIICGVITAE